MATVQPLQDSPAARTGEPLAARIAHSVVTMSMNDVPAEVTDKVKLCLFDLIGCAFESRDLPWSRQAVALAEGTGGAATVIGSPHAASHADAAFANAVMGHGLVREAYCQRLVRQSGRAFFHRMHGCHCVLPVTCCALPRRPTTRPPCISR